MLSFSYFEVGTQVDLALGQINVTLVSGMSLVCVLSMSSCNLLICNNVLEFLSFEHLKFIYSEKATKILRNLHLLLTVCSTKVSQTFCGLPRIYEL